MRSVQAFAVSQGDRRREEYIEKNGFEVQIAYEQALCHELANRPLLTKVTDYRILPAHRELYLEVYGNARATIRMGFLAYGLRRVD
jgi:hypothetical protein